MESKIVRSFLLATVIGLSSITASAQSTREAEALADYEAREQDTRTQATIDSLRRQGRHQEAFRLQEQLIQRRETRHEARMRRLIAAMRRDGNKAMADRLEAQLMQARELRTRAAQRRREIETAAVH